MDEENGQKNRVIGYIDGFNLYHGIKEKRWKEYYWIDPDLLIQNLVSGNREVVGTKYFTAPTARKNDGSHNRQSRFLDMLGHMSRVETIKGKFHKKNRSCRSCGSKWIQHEEKMTDTAIATHFVADAFLDSFDTALLIGGDTDITPAIKMVKKHFPEKRIEVWFPPTRQNDRVGSVADDFGSINGEHLRKSMMPDSYQTTDGYKIEKPESWS